MKQSKEKHKKYKYEPEGNNKGVNLQQSNSILLSLSFCFCSFPVGDFSSKSDFAVVEGFFLLPFFLKRLWQVYQQLEFNSGPLPRGLGEVVINISLRKRNDTKETRDGEEQQQRGHNNQPKNIQSLKPKITLKEKMKTNP